ncbi:MAG: hypothetical protein HC881_08625 [Leptolyngbyaceae cyanobacterium SL_7_1]|nr:hypothetical protein [Leptolyngbyaceae cyanobacterium SL_7_1]
MFSRLTLLRDRCFSRDSTLPPCHPERLPSFEPLLLGSSAVLLALLVLSGCSPVLWLAPILFTGLTLHPPAQAIALLGGVVWSGLLLLNWEEIGGRQWLVLGIVGLLSPLARRTLLQWEWRNATQTTLASLTQNESTATFGAGDRLCLATSNLACADGRSCSGRSTP